MISAYTTIAGATEHELVIRKSRFIGWLVPVTSQEDARAVIAERRREHWAANHNCTAFVLGPDADTQRSSDDGEPSGTAGVPMLEVLTRRGLTDVVAVVTRYFGGVKLGAGGLIRAYSTATNQTTEQATLIRWEPRLTVAVTASHDHAGRLEHELRTTGYHIAGAHYGADVQFEIPIQPEKTDQFAAWLDETTSGTARWSAGDIAFHRV